jgi:hypothetical protein
VLLKIGLDHLYQLGLLGRCDGFLPAVPPN